MSKSNLKNINTLNQKKTPYILYQQSTYSNLLYKLQKSCIWNQTKNAYSPSTKFYFDKTTNIVIFLNHNKIWYDYKFLKTSIIRYNPNKLQTSNSNVELTSTIKYQYTDIDLVKHFEKLKKNNLKLQNEIKEYKSIFNVK